MSANNQAQSKHSDQTEGLDTDPPREAQEEQSTQLESHPLSAVFSPLDGPERDALKESIQKNGIREPIVLLEGKILDGRNRYCAALALNLSSDKIPIREFDPTRDGNPIDFVWDQNINRRHLNETQRGLAAAEMESLRHGGNRKSQWAHMAQSTRRKLARRYGVGRDTIYCMSIVLDSGGPELKEVARTGRISVRTAKTIAEMPPWMQKALIERTKDVPARERARALRVEANKEIQRAKNVEISKGNRALDPAGKTFDVIYADPAWQFSKVLTGSPWAIENHYPTMSIGEICALPVAKLAAPCGILFLWATDHHLIAAEQQVIPAWGFQARARLVWVKHCFGLGRFVRLRHEFLIIATRGKFPTPPTDCVPDSVISYPRREHSVKPPLHEMIEKMTPGLDRRIELFARTRVPGWEAWGNQTG